jgi:hypothetical protein
MAGAWGGAGGAGAAVAAGSAGAGLAGAAGRPPGVSANGAQAKASAARPITLTTARRARAFRTIALLIGSVSFQAAHSKSEVWSWNA